MVAPSLNGSREQYVTYLTDMLKNLGANLNSVKKLEDTLIADEVGDRKFVKKCTHTIGIAHLLMNHLGTCPNSVISEYNCLLYIDSMRLIDGIQDLKALGLSTPAEVVNYLTGQYILPYMRPVRSVRTLHVLDLLGLSSEEANKLGFTKPIILQILDNLNIRTIENTYEYLLRLGYTSDEIAKTPFILGYATSQISAYLDEYSKDSDSTSRSLKMVISGLERVYG